MIRGGGAILAFLGRAPPPPNHQITKFCRSGKMKSLKGPENGGRFQVHKLLCGLRPPHPAPPPPPPRARYGIAWPLRNHYAVP